jgi:hypothetical protein
MKRLREFAWLSQSKIKQKVLMQNTDKCGIGVIHVEA